MKPLEIIPIAISVLALVLSGITFWNDRLKPFTVRVANAGRVELAMNPYRVPALEPALMAELIFTNHGARSGAVQDVALLVTFPDQRLVLFRSMVISTDQSQQLGKELGQPRLESFVGFQLRGRDSAVKHILFVLERPGQYRDFAVGTYETEVRVLTDKQSSWKAGDKFTFTVDRGDLDLLAKTVFRAEPDGRYYVNWPRQSKAVRERESALELLRREATQ